MTGKMKKVIVKIPHRLTGFFEIVDTKNGKKLTNPEKIGSRGAGISLSAMGRTILILQKLEDLKESVCNIYINGTKFNENAQTTNYIFNYIKPLIKNPIKVKIFHKFDLPVGCGYGTSGSGALGTIYGLNKLLNLNLSQLECGRIAHISEVINKTGLGTICGLLCSGLCVLKEGGYPCVFEKISVPKNIKVICTTFGEIPTRSVLSDENLDSKIKKIGALVLRKFIKNPNIKNFMKCSLEFTYNTQILDLLNLNEIKSLIKELNKIDIIGASMNQLGRSVFAVCKKEKINEVIDVFKSYQQENKIFNLKIYQEDLQF
jgi:pantoate kinase